MNSNKKIMISAIVLLLAVFCVLSACKKNSGGEVVVVTDANGVPITNENGEAMTVVLETTIVEVTNANGEKVYDEDGNVKTSVIYFPQEVGVPVTDENGVPVTNADGEVQTTMIVVPPTTGGPVISEFPLTDGSGNPVTKEDGETVTYTVTYTTQPATPGDNNANWGSSFGGSGNDVFNDTAATPDGGFVGVVQSNSTDGSLTGLASGGTPVGVLIKYDKNGKLSWQKAIPADSGIIFMALDVDADGNIIAVGYSRATNLGVTNYGDYDAVIYKFSQTGDVQWVRNFGGSNVDNFNSVAVAPDGSYVVAGFTSSTDGDAAGFGLALGDTRALILKYSANGDRIFVKSFGAMGDTFRAIDCDQNGDIYAVGSFASNAATSLFTPYGRADAGIVKLSSAGDTQWIKQYGGSKIDNFTAITAAQDGGCVIAGRSQSADHDLRLVGNYGGADAVVVKYNADGSIGWQSAVRGYYDEEFSSIEQTADGYVVAGYSNSSNRDLKAVGNKGGQDALIVTFATSGSVRSVQTYGGSGDDAFKGLCVLSDGQVIACGLTLSSDGDMVGSKYMSDGVYTMGMIARFK